MKCVTVAKNLCPEDVETVTNLQKNSAKYLLGQYAKSSEERQAESEERRSKNASLLQRLKKEAESEEPRSKKASLLQALSNKEGPETVVSRVVRQIVGDKIATLGSDETISSIADCGLFATVLMAYNNHWKFRTSPDDWWFCVTRRVALAIDKHSKKDYVRKMFVDHEGKKELEVVVPSNNIYDVDYGWFFDEMSKLISENVKVPEYVDAVTADFSCTTPVQKIVSQITVMSSLQEFFEFGVRLMCGIPAVEMLGTDDDWAKLKSKLKVLRTLLEPIENDIELTSDWWSCVDNVFEKLLATFRGVPDCNWWSRIVTYKGFGSGPRGYTGWITEFLEGKRGPVEVYDFSGGLVTVPLTITRPPVEDKAALVAGMLGFTIHEDSIDKVPSVQPFQVALRGVCWLYPRTIKFTRLGDCAADI